MAWGLPTWLGGASAPAQPAPARPKSSDGGFIAPDRAARELCYESRDVLFDCLDRHNILDANKDDEKVRRLCPQENTQYEKDCSRSWIKYFKEKRVMEYNREQSILQIQKEDEKAAAKAKTDRKKGSWLV